MLSILSLYSLAAAWDIIDRQYSGEDCPECAELCHATPDDGQFTCPISRTRWVFCDVCDGWRVDEDHSVTIDGFVYCDTGIHDIVDCSYCDAPVLRSEARGPCDERRPSWHESCWYRHGICECSDCRDPDYNDGEDDPEGDPAFPCGRCQSMTVHMNLITETMACDCIAVDLVAQSVPVVLAHPIASLTNTSPETIDLELQSA